ncbi:uracil-DNA glycosylase [Parvibaculum sp.]|uniref:uracil-DNA glycosylase n=1 Tax=Parvibaculum sp. TaxID=2024848 RepID=UPI002B6BA682|nr:uracil-DNA glycosylase [Parvibaculum sp.]HUD52657.1 uracil-DNA glycosylase [Parvibaculum sp.]
MSEIEIATPEAPRDCPLCPRLVAYRRENQAAHPDWFNGPVPSFGTENARLLIVGLAPGVQGANRTGRPFTGDYAGDLLYSTLIEFGFAKGAYEARPDDGLKLVDAMISNAVRCVPPQNKPTPLEAKTCLRFFSARLAALPKLTAILALGRIAHDAVLTAHEAKRSKFPFGHQANHDLGDGLRLFDSYHCSRYNTNTGRLTTPMFHAVFGDIRAYLDGK